MESHFKDEDVKLLYCALKTVNQSPPYADLAKFLGVASQAARMRYSRLLAKCEKEFGKVSAGGEGEEKPAEEGGEDETKKEVKKGGGKKRKNSAEEEKAGEEETKVKKTKK